MASKMTGADTTSAVYTFFPVKLHDPVHKLHSINGTDFHNAALLTSAAHILIKVWNELTDNTQIIQVRFHTVVWTSAHCDFKFVRQFYIMPVYIKLIMISSESPKESRRPYWQVVPLQDTTGRTLEPVPPVSSPHFWI